MWKEAQRRSVQKCSIKSGQYNSRIDGGREFLAVTKKYYIILNQQTPRAGIQIFHAEFKFSFLL